MSHISYLVPVFFDTAFGSVWERLAKSISLTRHEVKGYTSRLKYSRVDLQAKVG